MLKPSQSHSGGVILRKNCSRIAHWKKKTNPILRLSSPWQPSNYGSDPVFRKEDCSKYDIGLVFKEIGSFSYQDKFKFIENVWKPGELFDFPASVECSNTNRHFMWSWLNRFPWLAYSKYVDGAFCLPCVCFGVQCGRNTNKLDKMYKFPLFTLWTSAISRFTKHASGNCEMHNISVIVLENFRIIMRREGVTIDLQINNLLQQQISTNREILKSLFETIIFCGKKQQSPKRYTR